MNNNYNNPNNGRQNHNQNRNSFPNPNRNPQNMPPRPANYSNYNRGQVQNVNNIQRQFQNPPYNNNRPPNRPLNTPPQNQPINRYGSAQQNHNGSVQKNDDRTRLAFNLPGNSQQPSSPYGDPLDIRVADRGTNYKVKAASSKKKHFKRFITFIICLILIASLLVSGTFIGIYSLCSKMNYIEDDDASKENFFEMLFTKEPQMNILLIGIDKESGSVSRSDTMMLVTIDNENEKIKLTSFMRDLWVTIPGYGENRLNSAYAKGGTELLIDTLKENFKVDIDNYLLIDFEMFVELIDGIDGVEVEITEKEAEFINRTTSVKVETGMNKLNGKEALVYCRIRKLDSDFMRTHRQRKVISAIIQKVKEQNITKTIKVGTEILPLITTNISPEKLTAKSIGLIPALKYEVEQLRVPVDRYYKEERINGQQVLVPDLEKNSEEINNFIMN